MNEETSPELILSNSAKKNTSNIPLFTKNRPTSDFVKQDPKIDKKLEDEKYPWLMWLSDWVVRQQESWYLWRNCSSSERAMQETLDLYGCEDSSSVSSLSFKRWLHRNKTINFQNPYTEEDERFYIYHEKLIPLIDIETILLSVLDEAERDDVCEVGPDLSMFSTVESSRARDSTQWVPFEDSQKDLKMDALKKAEREEMVSLHRWGLFLLYGKDLSPFLENVHEDNIKMITMRLLFACKSGVLNFPIKRIAKRIDKNRIFSYDWVLRFANFKGGNDNVSQYNLSQ